MRDLELLVSAQRALLGAISSGVRLVKISRDGGMITMTTVFDGPPSEDAAEAISIAATEIISDFPDHDIVDVVIVNDKELQKENLIDQGWVYRRME